MNVVWTAKAKRELRAVYDYIAQDSTHHAQRLVDRITRATERLGWLPYLGPEVPEYEDETVRELIERSYRVIYRLRPDRVEVVSVIHGARQLPYLPPGG